VPLSAKEPILQFLRIDHSQCQTDLEVLIMSEETKVAQTGQNEPKNEQGNSEVITNLQTALKELKENSVSRKEYDEVLAANKSLLETVVNGQTVVTEEEKKQIDINQVAKELFSGELVNLDYMQHALLLREELIKSGKPDPFLPIGKQISPTREDIEIAQNVADVVQECIDYAEGDNTVFTTELQRRTIDVRVR